MKLKLSIAFLLSFFGLKAQDATCSSGGEATGTGGSASYSLNYIVYTTIDGENGSVSQGVQQPIEISVVSSIKETSSVNLSCSAYPNPTANILILRIEEFNKTDITYLLFDVSGLLIKEGELTGDQATIDVSSLKPAPYLLKVLSNQQEIKSFKIIKNL